MNDLTLQRDNDNGGIDLFDLGLVDVEQRYRSLIEPCLDDSQRVQPGLLPLSRNFLPCIEIAQQQVRAGNVGNQRDDYGIFCLLGRQKLCACRLV